jgi:peroxiredoxin
MKLKSGDKIPHNLIQNIHGKNVDVPDPSAKFVHLQFRRFAGCPICNLHLQNFIKRDSEIKGNGIREVVVFHSPNESLLPYQGKFPFDVIGDPKKNLYRQFGVESSLAAILNPKGWSKMFQAMLLKDKPSGVPEGGPLGLPADFLIDPNGNIAASHYGTHASDHWSVDDLLALKRKYESK